MCKAIDDLVLDGEKRGEERGEKRGREQEENQKPRSGSFSVAEPGFFKYVKHLKSRQSRPPA